MQESKFYKRELFCDAWDPFIVIPPLLIFVNLQVVTWEYSVTELKNGFDVYMQNVQHRLTGLIVLNNTNVSEKKDIII